MSCARGIGASIASTEKENVIVETTIQAVHCPQPITYEYKVR